MNKIIRFVPIKRFTYQTRIQRLYNDGIDLRQQSVEINRADHIRRCSLHKDDDIWTFYKTIHPNVRTLGDSLNEGCNNSKDGPCVGILQSSNGINSLQWLSYSKVIEKSQYIGSYLWTNTKLIPMQSKVAIISENRAEYLFVEHACYKYGFIVVSPYTTYDSTTILDVLQKTRAEVLVVDNLERIQNIEEALLNNNQIKEIIVMDDCIYHGNNKIRSISTILGSMNKRDLREQPIVDPNSIATLIFTSGTTGSVSCNSKNSKYKVLVHFILFKENQSLQ